MFSRGLEREDELDCFGRQAPANQSAETYQSGAQQTQGTGFGNGRGARPVGGESGERAAVRSGSGAEVDGNAGKLARAKTRAGEGERNRVRAHNTFWLSLNVREIESEVPEQADVLRGLEVLEVQARIGIGAEPADTGKRKAGRSVEREVPAIQLYRETGVHGNGHENLVSAGVGYGHRTHRACNPQVIRAKVEGD